jgi:hypothetical protein
MVLISCDSTVNTIPLQTSPLKGKALNFEKVAK